jgi:AraC-like DNA-binding protein
MSKFVERLLKQGEPTWEQYNELERAGQLEAYFMAYIGASHGTKISDSVKESTVKEFASDYRCKIYEVNHGKIKAAILNHLSKNNAMPIVAEIAKASGLSRQTVYTHFQTFDLSEYFADETKKYQVAFMGIMDVLLGKCMSGDIKAMRLYFDIMAFSNRRNPNAGFLLGMPDVSPKDSSRTDNPEGPQLAYTKKVNEG